jgi:hypothetical protein
MKKWSQLEMGRIGRIGRREQRGEIMVGKIPAGVIQYGKLDDVGKGLDADHSNGDSNCRLPFGFSHARSGIIKHYSRERIRAKPILTSEQVARASKGETHINVKRLTTIDI